MRASQILFVVARAFVVVAVQLALARRSREQHRWQTFVGTALAKAAEGLGPVFVKFAQIASYRCDVFPQAILTPLSRLQEGVASPRIQDVRKVIEEAFGRRVSEIFLRFDERPIACGSIASVHVAQLLNGEVVAVKVIRPGVQDAIQRDIMCLRLMVKWIARTKYAEGLPLEAAFEQISQLITAQTDMVEELANLRDFSRMLAQCRNVKVPAPGSGFSPMRNVLLMEYIDDSQTIAEPSISEEVLKTASVHLLRQLYRMIFSEGLVHCDLHPGNVHLRANGTICLFDAGLVSRLSREDRECFKDFFVALATGDANAAAAAIVRSASTVPTDLDQRQLLSEVRNLVNRNTGLPVGQFLVVRFVHEVLELQRRNRLYGSPGFISAIWALAMFEGLIRHRLPDLDFQEEARPYILGTLIQRLGSSYR